MVKTNRTNGTKLSRLAKLVPLKMPLSLAVSAGNVCNLKCNYCYHGSCQKSKDMKNGLYHKKMLDKDLIDRIVEQSQQFPEKYKQATIVGIGEPLINGDISYAVRKLKTVADRVKIVTNATLLTETLSLDLLDAGLNVLKISLQGLTDKKYEEMCDVDISIEELSRQIRFFYEHREQCKVHIKIVDAALEESEEDLFLQMFGKISDSAWVEKLIEVDDAGAWINGENRWMEPARNIKVCYFPFYYIAIGEDGSFYPCCNMMPKMSLGNIYDKTIFELWNDEIKQLCVAHLQGRVADYEPCVGCNVVQAMYREENNLDDEREEILLRFVLDREQQGEKRG